MGIEAQAQRNRGEPLDPFRQESDQPFHAGGGRMRQPPLIQQREFVEHEEVEPRSRQDPRGDQKMDEAFGGAAPVQRRAGSEHALVFLLEG